MTLPHRSIRCPQCGKLVLVHDDGTLATHHARYRPGFERPRDCPAAGRKVMEPLPGRGAKTS